MQTETALVLGFFTFPILLGAFAWIAGIVGAMLVSAKAEQPLEVSSDTWLADLSTEMDLAAIDAEWDRIAEVAAIDAFAVECDLLVKDLVRANAAREFVRSAKVGIAAASTRIVRRHEETITARNEALATRRKLTSAFVTEAKRAVAAATFRRTFDRSVLESAYCSRDVDLGTRFESDATLGALAYVRGDTVERDAIWDGMSREIRNAFSLDIADRAERMAG